MDIPLGILSTGAWTSQGDSLERGFTEVDLGGTRSLTAKFATQRTPAGEIILGMNFLVDNDIELVLRGNPGAVTSSTLNSNSRLNSIAIGVVRSPSQV